MTRSNFEACLEVILKQEGGYVDHPDDPGGATNLGITRRTLAQWRGVDPWTSLSKIEVRNLQSGEAAQIYRALYWDRCHADQLPAGIDLVVFDFAVNSGAERAIKVLQVEIGVVQDGAIGPVTVAALGAVVAMRSGNALIDALLARRMAFLRTLSTFEIFGRGWTSRIATIRREARSLASTALTLEREKRSNPMDLLAGYKTYIVGAAMVIAAIAQIAGVEIPAMSEQTAGQMLLEAFAIIFLRRGMVG